MRVLLRDGITHLQSVAIPSFAPVCLDKIWVNHEVKQWAVGIHNTNSIEGFWSHLKRGLSSTHCAVSPKHLQAYVNEFAFRFNNRHEPAQMFGRLLGQISRV